MASTDTWKTKNSYFLKLSRYSACYGNTNALFGMLQKQYTLERNG